MRSIASEWSLWAEDFRVPHGAAIPSADEIIAQARRDARREWIAWTLQIGGTLFVIAAFLALIAQTRSAMFAALSAIVLPAFLVSFGCFVYFRPSRWSSEGSSVTAHVALAVRRRSRDHRMMRVSRAVFGFLVAAHWVWYPLFLVSRIEKFAAEPWRIVVGTAAAVLVFGVAWWFVTRTARTTAVELAKWKQIESWLGEGSGEGH